ncbi:putative photosynthetic complex assembly protein PuhE [Phenylobacterium sp.]|uniref:putative photosynthetic complex assembly protein PuhE n=1 Tax=Phenylobacterium sp. TaxID=1871053 RepID=UPI0025CF3236|nr:putative photosynthetic complex assembly protein PuhE [Phenylobacterium sp.]
MIFAAIGSAVLYTIFLWWFSTGAILWLDRRPSATYRWTLVGGSVVAVAAMFGLAASLSNASPMGAVLAFTCALGLWGWHELSFLTGFIAGPRRSPCPPDARSWRRFSLATSTVIHHEIALALTAAAIVAISWNQPNQVGCWTFAILFAGRLSAKLNLFLGVPNFNAEFFPDHLQYLTSYLRKGPMTALFPLSILAGGALAWVEAAIALKPDAGAFELVSFALVFALTALAIIEHAFMVLPLHDAALWRWALPTSARNGATK